MELIEDTISFKLWKDRRGQRLDKKLDRTWFLNGFKVNWNRSHKTAKIICKPAFGGAFILAERREGVRAEFDYDTDPFFTPVLVPPGSTIELVCEGGSASAYIELRLDVVKQTEPEIR